MTDRRISYRTGYKHQLAADYSIQTDLTPIEAINNDFIALTLDGYLTVKKGYAWDGTSGPVKDTKQNLRASLVHDAFYQLMRREYLKPTDDYKDKADQLFRDMCIEDGVFPTMAEVYYEVLKRLGEPATEPENVKEVYYAP